VEAAVEPEAVNWTQVIPLKDILVDFPLYHSMVYGAMEYYKKHGGRWIEVSQPFNPSAQFGYYPDAKQINIGQFKRGFAGRWVDEYRGIKYFDQSLAAKEIEDFKQHYAKV
jgi:hypothetical protein